MEDALESKVALAGNQEMGVYLYQYDLTVLTQNLPLKVRIVNPTQLIRLRGCLKKIDKISYSVVTGVISLSGSVKSCDFEQYLVSLGLNSHFLRVPRPKYMMPTHKNL